MNEKAVCSNAYGGGNDSGKCNDFLCRVAVRRERMRMEAIRVIPGSGLMGMVMEFPRVITSGQMGICFLTLRHQMDIQ